MIDWLMQSLFQIGKPLNDFGNVRLYAILLTYLNFHYKVARNRYLGSWELPSRSYNNALDSSGVNFTERYIIKPPLSRIITTTALRLFILLER
jgi:hypothetical protein